ncbi:hypothetical protein B481_1639 [Planococcus halocryophilus Or1]|nr:hypothetical protein B481_1639 [Planococcus halocryophilus Or1]
MTKLFQEKETDQSELLQKAKKAKSASAILAKSTTKQKITLCGPFQRNC